MLNSVQKEPQNIAEKDECGRYGPADAGACNC